MTAESPRFDDMKMDLGAMVGAVLSRWLRIVLVTLVLLGTTYAVLSFMPRLYESTASILVEQRENAFTRPASGVATTTTTTATPESAISSQIELIKSRDTLLRVIDTENLRSVPELNGSSASPFSLIFNLIGRRPDARSVDDTILQTLNDRLTVVRERDSAFISIIVQARDPELAARLANAIAYAHVQRRADLSIADTAEASTWLEEAIVKLRDRVTEAETAVANYRAENDLFEGANNTSLLDQQLSNIATQITSAQERRNAAESRANLIRGLVDAGQRLDGVPDVQNSVTIQQLSQSRADLQRQLAERSATLLPNHPTIRSLAAQVGEIEQQIAAEGRRVAESLEAEARIEGEQVASLQSELDQLKVAASRAGTSTVALDELEREAKAQRDLLESYLSRYREAISRADVNSSLPDVRVVTLAAPSQTPASPKTGLVLGAVAFASIALQVGGIMFGELMSGRAVVSRGPRLAQGPRGAVVAPIIPPAPVPSARPESERPEPRAAAAVPIALTESEVHVEPEAAAARPDDTEIEDEEPDFFDDSAVSTTYPSDVATLAADIALGRVRVVMIAALNAPGDCAQIAEALVAETLRSGISVVRVDAGSGRISPEPGITDLASDRATFGDVVHKGGREGLAEVSWGHQSGLDRRSTKPLTLVEALTDIYEVVIVHAGRTGMGSSLSAFAGIKARLVLVSSGRPDPDYAEAALADAAALGFDESQVIHAPTQRAEVA